VGYARHQLSDGRHLPAWINLDWSMAESVMSVMTTTMLVTMPC